ncbi:glycosyltransferase [Rubrivirga sp.]|uniref:glycosyltransferase n=1 Tax=Rubrivirga sp. TaxID=1885344 RepID=UPI003C77E0E3
MTILHLGTTHRAGDPRIVHKEAQTLAAAGLEVGVVVPGESDLEVAGVPVFTVPLPSTGKERMTTTTAAVVRRALGVADADTVFHIHDADLLLPALRLALRGRRVVYDAHEDVPRQTLHQAWIPRPLRRLVGLGYAALEAAAGRAFAGIIAAEPVIYDRYPADKTALVRNFTLPDELAPPPGHSWSDRERAAVYVGSITETRGVWEMIEAVGRVPGTHLHLAGPFHPRALEDEVRAHGADHVAVWGRVDRPTVARLLARSRVGLSVLHPTPKYLEAYPTKLFEYQAAGLPLIASDFPVIRPFVDPHDCGILVDPQNVEAVTEALRRVLEDDESAQAMGERGRAAVLECYSWDREGERLVAFYRALLDGSRRPGAAAHRVVPIASC